MYTLTEKAQAIQPSLNADLGIMSQHARAPHPQNHAQPHLAWAFHEVKLLIMAIGEYIEDHNKNPESRHLCREASDVLETVHLRKDFSSINDPACLSILDRWRDLNVP